MARSFQPDGSDVGLHYPTPAQTLGEPRLLVSRAALLHNARVIRRALDAAAAEETALEDEADPWHVPPRPRDRGESPLFVRPSDLESPKLPPASTNPSGAAPAPARICAVLRADAYGHGAALVADALCNFSDEPNDEHSPPPRSPIDQIAVSTIDEAAALPEGLPQDAGLTMPTLILRPTENAFVGRQRAAIEWAIRNQWVLTLQSLPAIEDVARIAVACDRRALVNLQIDTGLGQAGCACEEVEEILSRLQARTSLKLVSIGTDLMRCTGDPTAAEFVNEQVRRFRQATDGFAAWSRRVKRHATATDGIFLAPQAHFDIVRCGSGLLGIDPAGKPSVDRPLRPATRWTAPLIRITSTGDGSTRGLVPVGFADGYPRAGLAGAVVRVHDAICPVVGEVSADYLTIDLSGVADVAIGDEVTLVDHDPLSRCSAYACSGRAGMKSSELLCRIGQRTRRVPIEPADPPRRDRMSAGAV